VSRPLRACDTGCAAGAAPAPTSGRGGGRGALAELPPAGRLRCHRAGGDPRRDPEFSGGDVGLGRRGTRLRVRAGRLHPAWRRVGFPGGLRPPSGADAHGVKLERKRTSVTPARSRASRRAAVGRADAGSGRSPWVLTRASLVPSPATRRAPGSTSLTATRGHEGILRLGIPRPFDRSCV